MATITTGIGPRHRGPLLTAGALIRRACSILVGLLLAISAVAASANDVTPSERVTRSVIVRAEPSTRSAALGALRPGESARIEGEVPGWYRVRLPDGTTGFVSKSWTRVIVSAQPLVATPASFKVHVIDVGTGLAVFIEGPGFTMLYDGGSQDDLAMGTGNRIVAYLKAARPDMTTIDHLILSHPHKDHVELLPDVFDGYVVRNVWDSGALNPTRGYCLFLRKVALEPGVAYHDADATGGFHEVTFPSGSCSGTIRIAQAAMMTRAPVALGPSATMSILHIDSKRHSDPNDNSVVVRLDLGDRRVLLAGDAEAGDRDTVGTPPRRTSIEGKLLDCCIADLRADVLIVGHHGSLTSSRKPFLDAIGAKVFVISSGPHPYQGVQLPDEAVETELRRRGTLLSTKDGDEACLNAIRKVGLDADESPGGCSSVLVTLGPEGVTAGPSPVVD